MPQNFEIYLASASPRRRELLEQVGVTFRLLFPSVPEVALPGEEPERFAMRVAQAKARVGRSLVPPADPRPVLGADTVVTVDGEILGKPRDRQHGLAMLERLSGRTHQVITAVSIVGADAGEASATSTSSVTFRTITESERKAYWSSGEPSDKAGGYAIQGRGALFVAHLEGSYSGVMGLPLFETGALLESFGIHLWG